MSIDILEESVYKANKQYDILGTAPEEQFDNLTQLASNVCGVPISLIGFVDQSRYWFKSKMGLEVNTMDLADTFCKATIEKNDFYEIQNLTEDTIYSSNPLVTNEPHVQYYAGVPLKSPEGVSIGTICIMDHKPRKLTADQKFALEMIAKECALQVALRLQRIELDFALEEANDLYNNAPCGYHSVNAEGIIVKINETELKWLGYKKEDVIGKSFSEFVVPADREYLSKLLTKLKDQGYLKESTVRLLKSDGTFMPISITTSVIRNTKGDFVRSRSICYDISDQKKIEVELNQANEKLKAANDKLANLDEDKNKFLGMAAHDLKNPIMAIITLVGLVKKEKDLSPIVLEYLSYIEQSSVKMRTLISDLLDLTRIELGTFELEIGDYDLVQLLKDTVSIYQSAANKKKISIIFSQKTDSYLFKTDKLVFVQIIDNLLSNAIKFSPTGKKVQVGYEVLDKVLLIKISDQGPGIKPEEMGLLFQKFKRLSNKPTGGESTTGLGLSIVKEYTERFRGKVYCESQVGEGTTFCVELPLQ